MRPELAATQKADRRARENRATAHGMMALGASIGRASASSALAARRALSAAAQRDIVRREELRGEQRGVGGAGLADGERGNGHAGRHLHDAEQRIQPVERRGHHRHARAPAPASWRPASPAGAPRPPAPAMIARSPRAVRASRRIRRASRVCDGRKRRAPRTGCPARRGSRRRVRGCRSRSRFPSRPRPAGREQERRGYQRQRAQRSPKTGES